VFARQPRNGWLLTLIFAVGLLYILFQQLSTKFDCQFMEKIAADCIYSDKSVGLFFECVAKLFAQGAFSAKTLVCELASTTVSPKF